MTGAQPVHESARPATASGNAFSRGISFVLPAHLVRVVLLFGGWAIAARFVTPEDLGTFVLLTVAADFLALIADFGMTGTIVRFLSVNTIGAKRVTAVVSGFLLLTSLTVCAVVYWWGGTFLQWTQASGDRDLSLSIAVLFACQYYLAGLSAFLQGLRLYRRFAVVQLLEAGLRMSLVLFCVAYLNLGLNGLVLAAVCSSAVAVVAAYWLMPWRVIPAVDLATLRQMLGFGMPLQVQSVMGFVFERTDVLMLGAMVGPSSVAAYDVAYKGPNQLRGLFAAFRSVFFPHLAGHYGAGQTLAAERFLKSTLRMVSSVLAAATLVTAVYGRELVSLVFSPVYAESGPVAAVLMAGVSIGLCNFLLGLALIASGRPRAILRAAIPEAAINIAANAILIPRFGLMGAAGASVISRCVANPVFLLQLARSQSWPTAVCYLRAFLNMGIAYAAFWLMSPLGDWAGLLSLGVFAVLSVWFGGLEWDDLTLKNAGSLSTAPMNDIAMIAEV